MQTFRRAGTVIVVSARSPDATVAQDINACGVAMYWAPSIAAADGLLNSVRERAVIVTELALPDGNWRDVVERVRSRDAPIAIVLLTSARTAELWWDALECGIDEILPGPLMPCPLCQFVKTYFTS
jgi:DNA-binding NarL/FixJ family response regulator